MHFLKFIQTEILYCDDLLFICIILITFLKVQIQKQVFFFKNDFAWNGVNYVDANTLYFYMV